MAQTLAGKVALVTGGSRGLGLQTAEALGDYGATVAISARKQHELDAALAHLRARGSGHSIISTAMREEVEMRKEVGR